MLRRLTIDDYDDLLRIWGIAGLPYRPRGRDRRDRIEREMARPETGFFGIFEDDRMVAAGLATFDGRKGWINRVAVDPDCRRRGLAVQMIEACEVFLNDLDCDIIACFVEEYNTPSMALFQKLGYLYSEDVYYFSKRKSDDT